MWKSYNARCTEVNSCDKTKVGTLFGGSWKKTVRYAYQHSAQDAACLLVTGTGDVYVTCFKVYSLPWLHGV